ncbi:hypothetical protein M8C21_016295, partial [Ambrosia artemisiifolia]
NKQFLRRLKYHRSYNESGYLELRWCSGSVYLTLVWLALVLACLVLSYVCTAVWSLNMYIHHRVWKVLILLFRGSDFGHISRSFPSSIHSPQHLYKELCMGNTEMLLLLPKLCGMVQQLLPSNYLGLLIINGIMDTSNKKYIEELCKSPQKIAFYDYIENNLAKRGLFKMGSIHKGEEIAVGWLGHHIFIDNKGDVDESMRGIN